MYYNSTAIATTQGKVGTYKNIMNKILQIQWNTKINAMKTKKRVKQIGIMKMESKKNKNNSNWLTNF